MMVLSPESSALQIETPTSPVCCGLGLAPIITATSGACGNKLCELCRTFYAKYLLLNIFEYFSSTLNSGKCKLWDVNNAKILAAEY